MTQRCSATCESGCGVRGRYSVFGVAKKSGPCFDVERLVSRETKSVYWVWA